MSRAFGVSIQNNVHHQRKALACISQNPAKNIVKSNGTALAKSSSSISLSDQENVCVKNHKQQQTFKIYQSIPSPASKNDNINVANSIANQEELLQENIEAVKKELNNFLIDSFEKSSNHDHVDHSEDDKENNICKAKNIITIDDDIDMIIDDGDDENNEQKEKVENDNFNNNNCQSSSNLSIHSDISYVQHYSEFELLNDYSLSIWSYMLEKERQFMPNPFYMHKQPNINTKMRSILVDWLVDVADEYKLKDETLYLAINYIDRFLSKFSITRQDFQLLGTASLFISTKYEEVYPPDLSDFVYITDDSYSNEQILAMEKTILNGLSFDVSVPTSNYFLDMYATTLVLDRQIYCLAKYLNQLTTLECTPFLKYYPSEIALCSIMLAGKILQIPNIINDDFVQQSLSYEKQLGPKGDIEQLLNERNNLFDALNQLRLYANKHPQQAIQKKYSEDKYFNVSKIADEANIF